MKRVLTLGIAAVALSGCAFVTEGVRQDISVNTTPQGANCAFMRSGQKIAEVNPTPGSATIRKTKDDITLECEKDGYQKATLANKSDFAAATVCNVIIGGLVGVVVDVATGSVNKYDDKMDIVLQPVPTPTAEVTPKETGPLTN